MICKLFEMDEPLFQVGTTFDSWESFKVALDKYFQIRHMQFYCVNSRTVEAANKLLTTSAGKDYANNSKYTYIKQGCKHYGNPRKAGHGIHSSQKYVTYHI